MTCPSTPASNKIKAVMTPVRSLPAVQCIKSGSVGLLRMCPRIFRNAVFAPAFRMLR